MTDVSESDGNGPIQQVNLPADAPQAMTVTQAARLLQSLSRKQQEEQAPAAPTEAAAEPTQSPAQAEDASPEEAPSTGDQPEAQAEAEPEAPPIEPPRSWKAEEKERFKSLPRDTQAYIAEREQERDRALSRSQNETAEKLKGLTAKEQAVEQARQQYEAALPQLLQVLQSQQMGEFADIKTITDVENLARNDWPRYLQWDLAQKKIAAVQQEMQAATTRQVQEKQQKFAEYANKEDSLFTERAPEMSDSVKADQLRKNAVNTLKDLGFNDQELAESWMGQKDLSLRDHRLQLLIRDATLWRNAQQKAVAAAKKPVPPVQRPGVQVERNSGRQAEIHNLSQQLDKATGVNAMRIAAQLVAARRAAR